MKRVILLTLLVIILTSSSCKFGHHSGVRGSGTRKTEARELKAFKTIDTTGSFEINITAQKPASFEIEADDNIVPLIKTEVRGDTLFVTTEQSINPSRSVRLRVTLPELAAVTSRGAGEINIVDANSDSLKLESLGAASIEAAGKAKTVTISSTGAGKVDAGNLIAEKANVDVKGAASVEVNASEQLDVTVAGAGSVQYSGNPKVVNKHVSGIGSVSSKSE